MSPSAVLMGGIYSRLLCHICQSLEDGLVTLESEIALNLHVQ